MVGERTLPQTKVIPQVDLVITHGGNNTTTEALHFGKPMVLLPLFWDQYDNAQRMHELGFGIRLATYEFTPEQLEAAVETLLGRPRPAGRGWRRSASGSGLPTGSPAAPTSSSASAWSTSAVGRDALLADSAAGAGDYRDAAPPRVAVLADALPLGDGLSLPWSVTATADCTSCRWWSGDSARRPGRRRRGRGAGRAGRPR